MYLLSETIGCADGHVVAELPNPAVSEELLKEIMQWMEHGASFGDVISRLRLQTVPISYTVHTWQQGN